MYPLQTDVCRPSPQSFHDSTALENLSTTAELGIASRLCFLSHHLIASDSAPTHEQGLISDEFRCIQHVILNAFAPGWQFPQRVMPSVDQSDLSQPGRTYRVPHHTQRDRNLVARVRPCASTTRRRLLPSNGAGTCRLVEHTELHQGHRLGMLFSKGSFRYLHMHAHHILAYLCGSSVGSNKICRISLLQRTISV